MDNMPTLPWLLQRADAHYIGEELAAAVHAYARAYAEQRCAPFSPIQRRRLYDNSPEIHGDVKSFAAFERVLLLVEAAHNIAKQEQSNG